MPGPLTLTNFPGGISSFGVPVLGAGPFLVTGNTYFVHHSGSNNNAGTDIRAPLATLEAAINKCTANNGDHIIGLPGHSETIASASALAFDVAGVTIIGAGYGLNRPNITFGTAATTTINVSASNTLLRNWVLTAGFADIVAFFTLGSADDFRVENCLFRAAATDLNALHVFDTGTTDGSCDGLAFVSCRWYEPDAATLSFGLVDCAIDRLEIVDNVIVNGNATADTPVMLAIATGKNLTNAWIARNNIDVTGNAGTVTGIFITTDGTAHTGVIAYNNVKHLDATSEFFITATHTFGLFENRMTAVANAQGYLSPAIDS